MTQEVWITKLWVLVVVLSIKQLLCFLLILLFNTPSFASTYCNAPPLDLSQSTTNYYFIGYEQDNGVVAIAEIP